MPGLVALVARGQDVHVEAIGHKAFGDMQPIGRDAIFRIASVTRPMVRGRPILGATVAGVLIERVAGKPLPSVLAERVFEPLRMVDRAFFAPTEKLDRFTTFYAPAAQTGELNVLDAPEGVVVHASKAPRRERLPCIDG